MALTHAALALERLAPSATLRSVGKRFTHCYDGTPSITLPGALSAVSGAGPSVGFASAAAASAGVPYGVGGGGGGVAAPPPRGGRRPYGGGSGG